MSVTLVTRPKLILFYLTFAMMLLAVAIRGLAIMFADGTATRWLAVVLLISIAGLTIIEPWLTRRWPWFPVVYLSLQVGLISGLLGLPRHWALALFLLLLTAAAVLATLTALPFMAEQPPRLSSVRKALFEELGKPVPPFPERDRRPTQAG